ncbi:hypothetical protein OG209_05500 [Streptomyces sp. NBC_01383]|uniref:hypothetical protein n=1 Tax=Streptomyces TaxID=1883 RepID=UPI002E33A6FE|nr:hypothetical protein [Streptomyces brevispora]
MTPRTETAVVSHLLSDPPPVITGLVATSIVRSLHLVDLDYQDTVDAGYVESLDEFAARISKAGA